jgi:hypothetical protein
MRESTPRCTANIGLSGRAGEVALGCGELGAMGLIDPGGCCEACHSADGFAVGGARALPYCAGGRQGGAGLLRGEEAIGRAMRRGEDADDGK